MNSSNKAFKTDAIHQYFFMTDGAFDFYRPMVAFAFTFVVSSIGTLLKARIMRNKETNGAS